MINSRLDIPSNTKPFNSLLLLDSVYHFFQQCRNTKSNSSVCTSLLIRFCEVLERKLLGRKYKIENMYSLRLMQPWINALTINNENNTSLLNHTVFLHSNIMHVFLFSYKYSMFKKKRMNMHINSNSVMLRNKDIVLCERGFSY